MVPFVRFPLFDREEIGARANETEEGLPKYGVKCKKTTTTTTPPEKLASQEKTPALAGEPS